MFPGVVCYLENVLITVISSQTTGRKGCNSGQTVAPLQLSGENSNFLSAKKRKSSKPEDFGTILVEISRIEPLTS